MVLHRRVTLMQLHLYQIILNELCFYCPFNYIVIISRVCDSLEYTKDENEEQELKEAHPSYTYCKRSKQISKQYDTHLRISREPVNLTVFKATKQTFI